MNVMTNVKPQDQNKLCQLNSFILYQERMLTLNEVDVFQTKCTGTGTYFLNRKRKKISHILSITTIKMN